MSGVDPTEASMKALAADTKHNSESAKDHQAGFSLEEKRADSHTYSNSNNDFDEEIYEGMPTEEERETLRRVPGKINFTAFLIGYIELAERFSYYGCTVVFTNFIQRALPAGSTTGAITAAGQQAGALGYGQQAATGLTTFNQFWVYTVPLFGAWIADTYWGRYKTICVAVGIAFIGHVILVASSAPAVIAKPDTAIGVLALAIVIMGLGTGMFKSNIGPLVAEQVASHKLFVRTEKNGTKVLVDPAQTAARMYNWYYMCINVGALVGQIGMVYAERNHGFWLAFLLPTIVFATTPLVLYFGRNRYIRTPPAGSVLGKAMKTLMFCFKRKGFNPRGWYSSDFWTPAFEVAELPASEKPSWATWDANFVAEVRRGFKACQVFAYFPLYWLTYNQINNNLTSQAAVMNTHGLPNDILSNLDPFALIILIPIMDIFIYPAMRRAGINFTPIKRIFAGFMCGALAMMCAAITQAYIYKYSACGNQAATCDAEPFVTSLNVWIQTPSYVLIALSEIFASITSLEYAYTKAPKSMRSMVMAAGLFATALAAALGEAFLPLSADPLLVWNYGVMAVLSFGGGIAFWFNFRNLDKEELTINAVREGHARADKVTDTTHA